MSVKRQGGFSLIEMIIAIVIVSVGLAGLLAAFSTVVKTSADPLVTKQMLAVSESLLEEILLKPHAVSGTAPVNAQVPCGAAADRTGFDDIRDFAGYRTTGVCDADGSAVAGLSRYAVSVEVVELTWQGVGGTLRVQVEITRDGDRVSLIGYRTPYAS